MKFEVPIWEKSNLTLEEAAAYSGIGSNELRELTNQRGCNFVLFVGTKRLIKRRLLDAYLLIIDYKKTSNKNRCEKKGILWKLLLSYARITLTPI